MEIVSQAGDSRPQCLLPHWMVTPGPSRISGESPLRLTPALRLAILIGAGRRMGVMFSKKADNSISGASSATREKAHHSLITATRLAGSHQTS